MERTVNKNKANIYISDDQSKVLDIVKLGGNVYFTGPAGTGKTTLVDAIRQLYPSLSVVAPTGVAALNIDGSTIHSFFGLPYGPYYIDELNLEDEDKLKGLAQLTIIIFDEISMMTPDLFEATEYLCRIATKRYLPNISEDKPFGGKQIIMCGDFSQLPPVAKGKSRHFYTGEYEHSSPFIFHSLLWREMDFRCCKLTTQHRQIGQEQACFRYALERIRKGEVNDLDFFDSNVKTGADDNALIITTVNSIAKKTNEKKLKRLLIHGAINKNYHAQHSPLFPKEIFNSHGDPAIHCLKLCIGARVMTTINNYDEGYVNGSIGTVVSLNKRSVDILLDNGAIITVTSYTWSKSMVEGLIPPSKIKKTVLAEGTFFSQLPLKLAWAVTVHKSQGATYDKVHIEFGDKYCFSHGQLYVALSRCRTIEGMSMSRKLSSRDVHFSEEVRVFEEAFGL
ncbi:hypothetical protein GCM10007916_00440 [Psychromonas marina]|uniref:AAA+ ATPase domain-containing protein n=1 Tax=Psychromonas marina TaxID=88364 RepID=A0ABQ6DV91_9GAMM|nr:DEAD/DEAH box helicase [Psychromonas marina]GLS88977.1 hypothetical protein GCM10007916_00440 [Psychromonas marina]